MSLLENFVLLFVESAPWLLLGLCVAGIMKSMVPMELLSKHLGQSGFKPVVKAALIGAPLPLCSCGVIPAAMGIRRSGASKGATTSFLISTPETGVDSIAISYALLGPYMAIVRPVAAIVSAITAGLLVGIEKDDSPSLVQKEEEICCSSKNEAIAATTSKSRMNEIVDGLRFVFIDLVRDITPWLLVGLGAAALIQTFVPTELLASWGSGLEAFALMALIGIPMYVCATASTPIAAGLLFSGVSPGAVLVFMLVGPATNVATLGLVKNELGIRALGAYLFAVIGVSFVFGGLTNYWADTVGWLVIESALHQHSQSLSLWSVGFSAILALSMLFAMWNGIHQFWIKFTALQT